VHRHIFIGSTAHQYSRLSIAPLQLREQRWHEVVCWHTTSCARLLIHRIMSYSVRTNINGHPVEQSNLQRVLLQCLLLRPLRQRDVDRGRCQARMAQHLLEHVLVEGQVGN
jgi:hypothetical protein